MPFPPTPTNPWNTSQPPDTELANLLGQNLRDLKTDIMQRMSLLSGTFANRPTPEITDAVWGGAGFGLLYFSTDTNQIFQWNGAAWVDVSGFLGSRLLNAQAALPLVGGTGSAVQLYGYTLPANTLAPFQGIRVKAGWLSNHSGAPSVFTFQINGTVLQSLSTSASGQFAFEHTILRSGLGVSDTSKNGFIVDPAAGIIWTTTISGFPIDWTTDQVVELTFFGSLASNATPIQWIVERL